MVLDRIVDNFFAETEQVAFCTQNVVPGHRLHQRPAAPGPQLLVPRHAAQAARRPELHPHPGQRAEVPGRPLPAGRPHGDDQPGRSGQLRAQLGDRRDAGPARGPDRGFTTFPRRAGRRSSASGRSASPTTTARRASSSSARRRSSRPTSSTRSCSSCPRSRTRRSARGWSPTCATSTRPSPRRSPTDSAWHCPPPATPASRPITDLPASPALSILANGPRRFAGRKVGALVTDGTDADVLAALRAAIEAEGAVLELVAPKIGGVTLSDGTPVPAKQKIDGGPSVLYDAVAVLRVGRRRGRPRQRMPRPRTSSPTPTPTASSSATSKPRRDCSRRPASPT